MMHADHQYTAIDTETTGVDFNSEICEIALVALNGELKQLGYIETLVQTQFPVPKIVSDINGISNGMLYPAPTWKSIAPLLYTFMHGTVLVGHNVNFDILMLSQTNRLHGYEEGNNFMPGRPLDTYRFDTRSLFDAVKDIITKEKEQKFHTALFDAHCAAELLRHHQNKIPEIRISRCKWEAPFYSRSEIPE